MRPTLLALLTPSIAFAAPQVQHRSPRPAAPPAKVSAPRSIGVHVTAHMDQPVHVKNNPPHQVIIHDPKTNRDEHHPVIVEHRPAHVIDRDPHLRVTVRGYRPQHDWVRFHRPVGGWFRIWGINAWDDVGTVTCEATNEQTGELFPVSMDRDARGWDDDTVNAALDQALDDCYAEANGAPCEPVTPACSYQPY